MGQGSDLGRGEISPTYIYWHQGLASVLYNGYQVSFPGLKWPGHGINHPFPCSVCPSPFEPPRHREYRGGGMIRITVHTQAKDVRQLFHFN
jgi:hypothetical protein